MKTTNEIKKWLKENLGVTVKGNTGTGKSKWQSFRVPSDDLPNPHILQYSLPEFPEEFRRLCLRVIYGVDFVNNGSAGNIGKYSVAMVPNQWDEVMALWEASHPKA